MNHTHTLPHSYKPSEAQCAEYVFTARSYGRTFVPAGGRSTGGEASPPPCGLNVSGMFRLDEHFVTGPSAPRLRRA